MHIRNKSLILLILGACIIGLSPIFVRLSQTGPVATAFWRLSLSLAPFWIWSRGTRPVPMVRKDRLLLWSAGLFFAADLSVWHLSIGYTSVANATLLANLAPLFVALASRIFFHIRIGWIFIAGLILSVAGMGFLAGSSANIGGTYLKGDLLALSAAVFYAGYILSVKELRHRIPTPAILLGSGLISCAVLFPLGLLAGETLLPQDIRGWFVLLGLALVCHGAGQGLITLALAHLPAHFASLTLLLQPVVAALCAAALFSETLSHPQLAGGALVLSGIYLARRQNILSNNRKS
ncbi:MAG TPA: DMT family transporter [bacterium]|nr:DMT family transporter [bacterium]